MDKKSKYLNKDQVKRIYDTLKKMPKTLELDGKEIKPIGRKLFSPNMTLYIVEADIFEKQEQCFGYIKNEADPQMSEWGYINVPYCLSITVGEAGGFEQDLYFEDMVIDFKGNINKLKK